MSAENSPVGDRLREERNKRGLSQQALGDLVGSAKRTVIDWEKGATSPSAVQLSALAGAGFDVLYVVTGEHNIQLSKEQPVVFSDHARLQLAIEAVEEGLAEIKRKLPPAKKAELIVAAYELMAQPEQAKNVIRLVRVAA
jgi:transcriptional regulator with XRE-family HTH domain